MPLSLLEQEPHPCEHASLPWSGRTCQGCGYHFMTKEECEVKARENRAARAANRRAVEEGRAEMSAEDKLADWCDRTERVEET